MKGLPEIKNFANGYISNSHYKCVIPPYALNLTARNQCPPTPTRRVATATCPDHPCELRSANSMNATKAVFSAVTSLAKRAHQETWNFPSCSHVTIFLVINVS